MNPVSSVLAGLMTIVLIYAGWQHYTIKDLKAENLMLSQQVESAKIKAENNKIKADRYDQEVASQKQRHYQDNEFKKVILNAPESENGPIAVVMQRALNQLPKPTGK